MSKLNINKIGIVSRDYRNREKNGHRDFSYAFKSILTTLDEQACDSVLFSLYTINKRTSFNVESILKELKIKNIRTIFLEEFKDSEERIPLENVIYYQEKGQWREQRLTQKFAKGGVKNKVAESFKKGDLVMVEGSLRNDSWEKDGVKHNSFKVRVNNFSKLTKLSRYKKDQNAQSGSSGKEEVVAF